MFSYPDGNTDCHCDEWLAGGDDERGCTYDGSRSAIVRTADFFMHLRDEKKPRYNLISLILGLVILLVIVAGSMWIMLYNMVAL